VEFSGLELTPGPHLLLDDYLIESTAGVRRYVHAPVRDANIPNPLITGEQDGNIAPYLAVLRDGGRFKIWYNTSFDDQGSNQSRLGYLESTDGIHWT
jgi:hypothetical protein